MCHSFRLFQIVCLSTETGVKKLERGGKIKSEQLIKPARAHKKTVEIGVATGSRDEDHDLSTCQNSIEFSS